LAPYASTDTIGRGAALVAAAAMTANAWTAEVSTHAEAIGANRLQHASRSPGNLHCHWMASSVSLCNTRANIRRCSRGLHNGNRRKGEGGTSAFKGVSRRSDRDCWTVHVVFAGKVRYVGDYESEIDAAIAYDQAAWETFGEFALLNFADSIDKPSPQKRGRQPSNGCIYFDRVNRKWRAEIRRDGERLRLGRFATHEEASAAIERVRAVW
jgi:hypothetical protein